MKLKDLVNKLFKIYEHLNLFEQMGLENADVVFKQNPETINFLLNKDYITLCATKVHKYVSYPEGKIGSAFVDIYHYVYTEKGRLALESPFYELYKKLFK